MKYRGSCHCGKVAIEVEGEITGAVSCNCSICSKRGSLLWFVPREQMKLTGEIGTHDVHVQQTRHQASLLQALRRAAVRRRHRSERRGHRGDQHPLPRGFRVREGAGAPLQRQGVLTRLGATLIYMRRAWPDSSAWRSAPSRRTASRRALAPDMLAVFETGVRYQMYHAFALFAAAWGCARWQARAFAFAGWVVCRRHRHLFGKPVPAGVHRRALAGCA